jgi:hypothetical protein
MTLEITQVDFLGRLLWALAIIGGGIGLYGLVNRWSLLRARGKFQGLESARPGVPVLLYFTTPTCAARPYSGGHQAPARAAYDQLQVIGRCGRTSLTWPTTGA